MGSQQSRPSSTYTRKSSIRSFNGSIRSRRSFKLKQQQQQSLPPTLQQHHGDLSELATAATTPETLPKSQLQQSQHPSQQQKQKQKQKEQCDATLPLGQHLQPQYQRPPKHRPRRSSPSPPSRSQLSRTYSVISSSSSSMSSAAWSGGLFSQLDGACSNITNTTDFSSHYSSIIHQPKETWPELMPSIPNSNKRQALTASEILAQLEFRPSDAYNIFKIALSPDNKIEFFQAASAWLKQHPESNVSGVYVARCLLDGWGVSANPTLGLSQLKDLATKKDAWEAYLPLAEYYYCNHLREDAAHWYTRATKVDDKEMVGMAQYRLGELCALSEEDLGLAWFKMSANNGNKFGQYIAGINYQYGISGTKDTVLAQKYLLASAEQEFSDAQCALGIFFFEEAHQPAQGRIWIDRAVKQNNVRALFFLGGLYDTQGLYEQALGVYKTAAMAADDATAQYHVGLRYRLGSMGLPQDYKEAVRYLSRSARHGYAPAQRVLGLMYAQGLVGNRKDAQMAFALFQRAASQGDVRAICLMGTSYEQNKQYDLALEQFRLAAQTISPYRAAAQLCIGQILLTMENTREAYDWFEQAASAGDDERVSQKAQLVLARYLLQGWAPVARDPGAGLQALQALADTGHTMTTAPVFYWLAACYEEGIRGVCERDQVKAFDYYLKAAEAGHTDSAFEVALILANQRRDRVGAFPWYEKAAVQGHRVAQYSAGLYYAKGIAGVATDLKKARQLFESSALQDFVPAMTSLGIVCRKSVARSNGRNHKLRDQMMYWYQKAADAGDVVAQRDLGLLFDAGASVGVTQNYEAAFELLTKASQQNDARATLLLGSYYQNGLVPETNFEKALALYDKAAKLGAPTAFYAAARVLESQGEYDKAYTQYKKAAENPSLSDSMAGKSSKLMLGRYILGYYYAETTAAVVTQATRATSATTAPEGSSVIIAQQEQQRPVSLTDLCGLTVKDGFRLLFELATAQQFPQAYFWLGNCYYDGIAGVASDYGKALEWYILAAEKTKAVEAIMKVAYMYELGQGTPVDTIEALKYYQLAADKELPEAQHKLGMAYWRGLHNVPINLGEAVLWFTHSASRHPASCWALGRMAMENGDQDVAIKWWHKAIAAGHTPSMRELASLLLQSSTSATDVMSDDDEPSAKALETDDTVEQAMNLLASAVQSGDSEALVMLGKQYQQQSTATQQQQQPLNSDIDEHEAEQLRQHRSKHHDLSIRCFEQAADMGHVEAMFLAAQSWHSQEQFAAALDHYERAANQGHSLSRVMRARYLIAGYGGIKADPETGYKELLHCAHEDSCVDAYNSLAQCHELGLGTVQDDRLALEWYLRSAEATQDAEAMFRIGQMYAHGRVPLSQERNSNKDLEALQWYRFACCSRNHPRAHYCVGLYYVHGIQDEATGESILESDPTTAKDHFRQAASQEDRDAMYELGQLLLFTETATTTSATYLQQNNRREREEGFEWLDHAAQLGSVAAQCEIAKLYHNGTDDGVVCQDFDKAYDYFCRAAQAGGDKTAALFVGTYYEHGIHVSPNIGMARSWYGLAAENGWWLAELALARLLHQQHTPAAQAEAYRLFKAAKDHAGTASSVNTATTTTSSAASLMVALYELNGWAGVQAQPQTAAQTLLELALQGESQAFLAVAQCYETGHGLPESKAEAFKWYGHIVTRQQGDDEGDTTKVAEAMFRLGKFYENGWDVVAVDRAKATDLYTLAAEHGCEEARQVLLL